jgi:hypothetical protein
VHKIKNSRFTIRIAGIHGPLPAKGALADNKTGSGDIPYIRICQEVE